MTGLDSLQARSTLHAVEHTLRFRKNGDSGLKLLTPLSGVLGRCATNTDIVVEVVGVVVVEAVARLQVLWIVVVPGTAAGCDQSPLMNPF